MKKLLCILSLLIGCWQASAQIESQGTPLPFALPSAMNRSANALFYTLNIDTTQALPTHQRNYVVGHVASVNFHTQNDGIWTNTPDGTRVWRMGLVSAGAVSMSVVLNQLSLPQGAKIFVYNPQQSHILGAFGAENQNEQGILPIRPLMGDTLIIEYQEPAYCPFQGSFGIERVAHNRKTNSFNSSNTCSPHANLTADLPQQKQAVCLLYVVSSVSAYYGSGCLINNSQGKPYVYSAAHTFKSADDAARTIYYFNYAVPAQNSNIQGTQECSIGGSTMRAYATGLDMALLELNQMPPKDYRPYLAGWTRTKTPQAPLISIQHPYGDSKKMSYDYNNPVIANYGGSFDDEIEKGWWYIAKWEEGVTEAGSSGSPLFDSNGLIIGALSGGNSTCNDPTADYYARLDTAWAHYSDSNKQLAHWLSPNNTALTAMQGADPYQQDPCIRLSHVKKGQTIVANRHTQGYYAGHNQAKHTAFAEKFTTQQGGYLYGAYLMPYKGYYNSSAPVYITVYDGNNLPNQELGRILVRPRDKTCTHDGTWGTATKRTWSKKENYLRFDEPIAVPATFFVGVEIQYNTLSSSDTLALYHTVSDQNNAYYYNGNQWESFANHSVSPANLSLWIDPVLTLQQNTAIDDVTYQNADMVYPNPTYQDVQWESSLATAYKLYNLLGQLVQEGTAKQVTIKEKGIYLLFLYNAQGVVSAHKVIRY